MDYLLKSNYNLQIIISTTDFVEMYKKSTTLGVKQLSNRPDHDHQDHFLIESISGDVNLSRFDLISKQLEVIWSEVLGLNEIPKNISFSELGGDSLLATVLATKIRSYFKIPFSPKQVVEHKTIHDQSEYIYNQKHPEDRIINTQGNLLLSVNNKRDSLVSGLSQLWTEILGFDSIHPSITFSRTGWGLVDGDSTCK